MAEKIKIVEELKFTIDTLLTSLRFSFNKSIIVHKLKMKKYFIF